MHLPAKPKLVIIHAAAVSSEVFARQEDSFWEADFQIDE
jgi:hypothetical protein